VVPWWWSWLLTLVGVTGLWAAGSKKAWGWAIGMAAQGLWVAYAITTKQYGFLLAAACYWTVYFRNWRKWRQEKLEAEVTMAEKEVARLSKNLSKWQAEKRQGSRRVGN